MNYIRSVLFFKKLINVYIFTSFIAIDERNNKIMSEAQIIQKRNVPQLVEQLPMSIQLCSASSTSSAHKRGEPWLAPLQ